jgi:hypothetical protein
MDNDSCSSKKKKVNLMKNRIMKTDYLTVLFDRRYLTTKIGIREDNEVEQERN